MAARKKPTSEFTQTTYAAGASVDPDISTDTFIQYALCSAIASEGRVRSNHLQVARQRACQTSEAL